MNDKLIKYMAVCLGISMCFCRISTVLMSLFGALAILLFFYLLYGLKKQKLNLLENIADDIKCNQKMILVLVLSMLPGVLFSYNIEASAKYFIGVWVVRLFSFFIITMFVKDRNILLKMLLAFLFVEAIESIFVAYKAMNGVYRPSGFRGYVMHLASVLVLVFPVLSVIAVDNNFTKKIRIFSGVMAVCTLAGIIAIQSRGGWLALLVVCPVLLYKYVLVSKKHMIIALLVITSIAGIFATSPVFIKRIKSITNVTTNRSNADRILVWESSFNMIKDHPVTGVGLDCWKPTYEKNYKLKEVTQDMKHSHNNFIQIFSEAGIFGFLGFFAFTIFMLWSNFKSWLYTRNPYALMLFGVWSAFTLFGMIDKTIDSSAGARVLWYLTGLLVVLKSSFKTERIE